VLLLLLFSTLASISASLILGIRLLRLAWRTRELPEFMIGSSFIVAGVIGYVMMVAGNPQSGALTPEQSRTVMMFGYGLISVGVCFLYFFIWRTFRPASLWAAALALSSSAVVMFTTTHTIDAEAAGTLPYYLGTVSRLGGGAWGAAESLQWWARMRKRQSIGLADPIVTNRFFLWGIANIVTFVIFMSTMAMPRTDAEQTTTSTLLIVISSLTIIAAAVQWFAFFPTRSYIRWVRGGETTQTA
jgi:hypothetical protein